MHSEPWFRDQDGWWYFYRQEGGKRRQVKLVHGKRNKKAAHTRWHELCRAPADQPLVCSESASAMIDVFLDWCKKNRSQGTYEIYLHHLQTFCDHIGSITVGELKPKHVTAWLDKSTWSDSTKSGAAQTVRTAFRWLRREGYIPVNPVAEAKGPSKKSREVILTKEQFDAILKRSRPDFQRLLKVIRHTGCRPQEAVAIEARHVDLDNRRIVFPPSEAKGKKHPRVIYLDDTATRIILELCERHPEGPILRNAHGKPWRRNMVRQRFLRLRKWVGGNYCAYHLRHTFATDALQKLDPITVATLMGHSDASTLARNYQHLAKLPEVMLEAAKKATS